MGRRRSDPVADFGRFFNGGISPEIIAVIVIALVLILRNKRQTNLNDINANIRRPGY